MKDQTLRLSVYTQKKKKKKKKRKRKMQRKLANWWKALKVFHDLCFLTCYFPDRFFSKVLGFSWNTDSIRFYSEGVEPEIEIIYSNQHHHFKTCALVYEFCRFSLSLCFPQNFKRFLWDPIFQNLFIKEKKRPK